jgi:hypothetical protein
MGFPEGTICTYHGGGWSSTTITARNSVGDEASMFARRFVIVEVDFWSMWGL